MSGSMIKKLRLPLLAASAIITALTLMVPKLGILEWVSLVPFAVVCFSLVERGTPLRKTALYLLFFFGVYYLVLFHWLIFMYPMSFLGISKFSAVIVVAAAWFGLTLLQALPSAAVFLLFHVFAKRRLVRRYSLFLPFAASALWVVFEWLFTLTWAGVPWSRLALGQAEMPILLGGASIFGSYFITFLLVAVNFLIAYAFLFHRKQVYFVAVGLFAANLAFGGALMLGTRDGGEPITVAAVQGNISSQDKWDTSKYLDNLADLQTLTKQATRRGAQIVVWSESTVPEVLEDMPSTVEFLSGVAESNDCYLMVGAFDRGENGRRYNGLYTFRSDGTLDDTVYHKRHLVPFGEYVPMRWFVETFIPQLASVNAAEQDLAAGSSTDIVETEYGKLGSVICFDSIYENTVRKSVIDGAQVLVVSTNDSWFSDSAALTMHRSQSVLRAVENGRWIIRAANTGISSVISPSGVVIGELGALQKGYVCRDIYARGFLTVYTRIGNVWVWSCMLGIAALAIASEIYNRRKRR